MSKRKSSKHTIEPVYCPKCGAYQRPIIIPLSDTENALTCKSCGMDLSDYIASLLAFEQTINDTIKAGEAVDTKKMSNEIAETIVKKVLD